MNSRTGASRGLEAESTDRMLLRRMVEADFDDLHRMYRDPRVMATLGGLRTEAETRASLERCIDHWDRFGLDWWTLRDVESGDFLGRGGLRHMELDGRAEIEIGYGFVAEAWGRGLATELARFCVELAFTRLGLDSVISFTLPTNAASRRVMEKAGLRYELEGVWAERPHVFYRLRRAEWKRMRGERLA